MSMKTAILRSSWGAEWEEELLVMKRRKIREERKAVLRGDVPLWEP
jgi:hypothetical protein